MKKNAKRMLAMLICLVLVVGVLPVGALAAVDVIASGELGWCGTTWTITRDGRLTINNDSYGVVGDRSLGREYYDWNNYNSIIKSIYIGSKVTYIYQDAFIGLENVNEIIVAKDNEYFYTDESGVLLCNYGEFRAWWGGDDYKKGYKEMYGEDYEPELTILKAPCNLSGTYIIPDGVKSIEYAFHYCTELKNVIIPDGVETLYYAFYGCSSLETVSIPKSVFNIDAAFAQCDNLTGIWVDEENETYFSDEYGVVYEETEIYYNDELHDVHSYLVKAPGKLSGSYKVRDNTFGIKYNAFSGCKYLESVTLPDGLQYVDDFAFYTCRALKNVEIPSKVSSIGYRAFMNCDSLESVKLPASVVWIDYEAFFHCDSLKAIWVDEDNEDYSSDENGILYDKEKTVLIQAGQYTNSVLADLHVPNSVEYIRDSALTNCHFSSLYIPASVIGIEGFAVGESAQHYHVDDNNLYYSSDEYGVLYNKDKTEVVAVPHPLPNGYVLPSSVTTINQYSMGGFGDDDVLLIIPASVTSVDWNGFAECKGKTIIRFLGDMPQFEESAFRQSEVTVYYPKDNATWDGVENNITINLNANITWVAYNPDQPQGDVDGDNEISNTDLILVASYVVEIYGEGTKANVELYGDMDGDGVITNADVIIVARKVVGLA